MVNIDTIRNELSNDGFSESEIDEILEECSLNRDCIEKKKAEIRARKIQRPSPRRHRCR